jgi:formylmethanofuran dehydrogenase subunit E
MNACSFTIQSKKTSGCSKVLVEWIKIKYMHTHACRWIVLGWIMSVLSMNNVAMKSNSLSE